jgi:hypothetical protein
MKAIYFYIAPVFSVALVALLTFGSQAAFASFRQATDRLPSGGLCVWQFQN